MAAVALPEESTLVTTSRFPVIMRRIPSSSSRASGNRGFTLIDRNSIQNKYEQFTKADIKGLLTFLRWMNFFISLAIAVFLFLSLLSTNVTFNLNKLLLTCYCLLFNGILCLYELHMKKLGERFRRNFGFLFTYIGRSIFVFLLSWLGLLMHSIGTIMMALGSMYSLLAIVVFGVAALNVIVTVLHPSFRRGDISLLDDPSVSYTSGDSVGAVVMTHV